VRNLAAILLVLALECTAATAESADAPITKGPHAKMLGTYGERQWGWTTYYHPSLHGLPTANGDKYDKSALTAAHVNLPLGTAVKVTNKRNGRSVVLEINDRRPRFKQRVLDVSSAAARELGMIERGIVPVVIEVVGEALPR
jgi:rare lipoprotein A